MVDDPEPTPEELVEAEALARALDEAADGSPEAETRRRLEAHRRDYGVDLIHVRARVLARARRARLRMVVPAALVLAAAAAIVVGTSRPVPAPIPMPEPDIALIEAQIRAASDRGLRTDLDVEAWRYRRRLFASMERRYDR